MKSYKVWVRVAVEEYNHELDDFTDVWGDSPVPIFESTNKEAAEKFAACYNEGIELFAVDKEAS